jgi:hypothetical protein
MTTPSQDSAASEVSKLLNAPFKSKAPPRVTKTALAKRGKKIVKPVPVAKPKAKKAAKPKAKKAKKAASKKAKKSDKPIAQGDEVKSRMVRVDAKFADWLGREAARLTREKKEVHRVTDVTRLLHAKLAK